ncbi:MAG: hypothetical protein ABWY52_08660, partial [Candidatus Limnocylindrales bacterium]
MNGNTDFDRIAQSWLQDGPTEMPDRSLQAALDEVHVTTQRRFGAARRTFPMSSNIWRVAAAAVIGILVIVGGLAFLSGRQGGVGGAPATTAPATASPTVQPSAAAGPPYGQIPAGTYRIGDTPIVATFPSGWENPFDGLDFRKNRDLPGEVILGFYSPDIAVYPDACATEVTPAVTGPTGDDLMAALRAQKNSVVSDPVDVTLGGVAAKRLEVSVPMGLDLASCHPDALRIWTATGGGYLSWGGEAPPYRPAPVYIVETPL